MVITSITIKEKMIKHLVYPGAFLRLKSLF
nr:MAG TPA: hypothetical protein [Caudoviricetes sp.]